MKENLTVGQLYFENRQKLQLSRVNENVGHDNVVTSPELTRPGVELAGYWDHFEGTRIHIIGNKEHSIISQMAAGDIEVTFKRFMASRIPCFIFANNRQPHRVIAQLAREKGVALFRSRLKTTELMTKLGEYLSYYFAPWVTMHGSLIDIYGVGVLFTGRSGIGKSEVALDLVERGHRLVADDLVKITRPTEGVLIGTGMQHFHQNLEIRGIGIIDVRALFGIRAVRERKRIEVRVELMDWSDDLDVERVGLKRETSTILDVSIPLIRLPIFPGKNITVISEVIALNHLLKISGFDAAREFQKKLLGRLKEKKLLRELEEYLRKDYE